MQPAKKPSSFSNVGCLLYFVALALGPMLFFILAVALGMNVSIAVFITLGIVIVIRFVLNIDY